MQQICKVLGEGFVIGLEYLFYLAPNVVAPFLVKIMPVLEKLCTEQKHELPSSSTFLHQVGSQPTNLHKLLIQERSNQTFEELHNHWHTFCDATEPFTNRFRIGKLGKKF
jgi:hypothetical protein